MRISIVNPNSTASMTEAVAAAARQCARPGTEIIHGQPEAGPAAIEGVFDGAMAVPGMLKVIHRADATGADAHIIACFDDTGLDAARSLARGPVIGIGEAAMLAAGIVGHRFSVITTLSRSVPIIEDNIARYGFGQRCRKVYACDIPVLALDDPASGALEQISRLVTEAMQDRAEAIVLGCAGMAGMANKLQTMHGIPVLEGVTIAVGLAETLVSNGISTSRARMWALPLRPFQNRGG